MIAPEASDASLVRRSRIKKKQIIERQTATNFLLEVAMDEELKQHTLSSTKHRIARSVGAILVKCGLIAALLGLLLAVECDLYRAVGSDGFLHFDDAALRSVISAASNWGTGQVR
ncbi:hypothetical protein SDC9_151485 [bioreactor metagenome]|uniref:Uncharacterized protein n=1 Tax=bioreactor metagenome TaxID=1076179 RepID=A0A645ESS4_9ZZZZ